MVGMMGKAAPLDDAASARKPTASGPDPDTETFEAMVAGLREHIFGKGEKALSDHLQQTGPGEQLGRVLGEITFALVREAASQVEQAGRELDMDILMGVATQVIDDLADLAMAIGIEVSDDNKEMALLMAQQLYVETSNPSDDERAAAKENLRLMHEDGSTKEAAEFVQRKGVEHGADPLGVSEMGGKEAAQMKRPTAMMGRE